MNPISVRFTFFTLQQEIIRFPTFWFAFPAWDGPGAHDSGSALALATEDLDPLALAAGLRTARGLPVCGKGRQGNRASQGGPAFASRNQVTLAASLSHQNFVNAKSQTHHHSRSKDKEATIGGNNRARKDK